MASVRGVSTCALLAAAAVGSTPPMPSGVNFGGWLCLEDWFFSGESGTFVSTYGDMPQGQGNCLPPALPQHTQHWSSEGHLVHSLNSSRGPRDTVEIFTRHRETYIKAQDFADVRSLGMRLVRLPLTWAAFADALAPINGAYGSHDPETEAVVVPDPYYHSSAAMVTVPRAWLRGVLRDAASHGLRVQLDLHAFPGGSSDGTYNGVWPSPPRFWTSNVKVGDRSSSLREAGLLIVQSLVSWVEGLSGPEREAVGGLTLMNEPAHMSFGANWAREAEMLAWVQEAADRFRRSQLPRRGVKLYVNMIDTAFSSPDRFWSSVPSWWKRTFSSEERHSWAVMDVHWYSAWSGPGCSGRTVGGGAYSCHDSLSQIRGVQRRCARSFADAFAGSFSGLKAVTEFSLGTFDNADLACKDKAVLDSFLAEQVSAFQAHDIEHYFWTWRMPYGHTFQSGWSLKYAAGKEARGRRRRSYSCLEPSTGAAVRETRRRRSAVLAESEGALAIETSDQMEQPVAEAFVV